MRYVLLLFQRLLTRIDVARLRVHECCLQLCFGDDWQAIVDVVGRELAVCNTLGMLARPV